MEGSSIIEFHLDFFFVSTIIFLIWLCLYVKFKKIVKTKRYKILLS